MRLELTRSCDHYPLKVACIPISPPARRRNALATRKLACASLGRRDSSSQNINPIGLLFCLWNKLALEKTLDYSVAQKLKFYERSPLCPKQDSNLHVSQHSHLKRARLPIPPFGLASVALACRSV